MIKYGIELRDWKTAETGAEEMVGEAQPGTATALAHYELGMVLMREGAAIHRRTGTGAGSDGASVCDYDPGGAARFAG
jgi:hypothetical protein